MQAQMELCLHIPSFSTHLFTHIRKRSPEYTARKKILESGRTFWGNWTSPTAVKEKRRSWQHVVGDSFNCLKRISVFTHEGSMRVPYIFHVLLILQSISVTPLLTSHKCLSASFISNGQSKFSKNLSGSTKVPSLVKYKQLRNKKMQKCVVHFLHFDKMFLF